MAPHSMPAHTYRFFLFFALTISCCFADEVNKTNGENEPTPTTHRPTVHGEGQPSIAGAGLWTFFGIIIAVALVADHITTKNFVDAGKAFTGAMVVSAGWVGIAFLFAIFLAILKGGEAGFVFVTGYLVEESLSVDNLVVIALIFKSFRIQPHDQGPVLKWGILGAIVFRLVFVFAGVWLLEHLHSMIYAFGALLLYSAYKMYQEDDDDDGDHMADHATGNSWMMRALWAVVPYRADAKCHDFFEHANGRTYATPMFAALVVVEISDLIFAVDSIPCILGLTHDLFLVFSSNMFAILGLRSLYLLLAEALDKVKNLKTGLAAVLSFVGTKMMLGDWFPLSQSVSLLAIFGILGATAASSAIGLNLNKTAKLELPF
mmetsp:Transcript_19104/g.37510  ORF Transcript_19104/g.37510 Transcript_19104/m.37510 type:complete len:375 (+) Transcript_19104:43-1167(+)